MNTLDEKTLANLFTAGARQAFVQAGGSEKDAEAFVLEVCKEAAARRVRWDEDDAEDEGTWWSRNKGWALPTGIGIGAFLLGGDAGRNGRPDRSYLSNAGSLFWERLKALLGLPDSALWRSLTETEKQTPDSAKGTGNNGPGAAWMTDAQALGLK